MTKNTFYEILSKSYATYIMSLGKDVNCKRENCILMLVRCEEDVSEDVLFQYKVWTQISLMGHIVIIMLLTLWFSLQLFCWSS